MLERKSFSLGRQAPARRRTLISSTLRKMEGLQGLVLYFSFNSVCVLIHEVSRRSTNYLRASPSNGGKMTGKNEESEVIFVYIACCKSSKTVEWTDTFCSPNSAVVEMPFSSTFSAAAGATELLRGWKVAQKIALHAL